MNEERVCEIKELPGVGGGRGVFAKYDLPPGFLLVLEWPSLTWPDMDLSDPHHLKELIYLIFKDPCAMNTASKLHPISLLSIDKDEIENAENFFANENIELDSSSISKEEFLRLFLVLKHNGFSSGLYNSLCMINHSCDPNCIKFEPRNGSRGASEVWTTRPIKAGEELFISYCSPLEQNSKSIREYLFSQHRFQCQCTRCVEMSKNDIESSNLQLLDIEETLENIESELIGSDISFELLWYLYEQIESTRKTLMALTEDQLLMKIDNDAVRINARLHMINTAICNSGINALQEQKRNLKTNGKLKLFSLSLIQSSLDLWKLQLIYLGKDHPILATTISDILNSFEFLQQMIPADEMFFWNKKINKDIFQSDESCSIAYITKVLKAETTRLKNLYMLARRCIEAVKTPKEIGKTYWGIITSL